VHTRSERYNRRKLVSSYFSITLSITLVLFLLGLLGLLVLNGQRLTEHYKERLVISIFLKDQAKEADIQQLHKSLSLADYTAEVQYISKEAAAETFMQELGEDFVTLIGVNPLKNSFDLRLKASYVTPEQVRVIAEEIAQNASVKEVTYDRDLLAKIDHNLTRISLALLGISVIFTLVAMLLINASIRLAVYSKRFVIKTMQLVGATKAFIRRPFILKHIALGLLSATLACIALSLLVYWVGEQWPEIALNEHIGDLVGVFIGIFVMGTFLSWISTYFAAQRFLNLHTDDLYY